MFPWRPFYRTECLIYHATLSILEVVKRKRKKYFLPKQDTVFYESKIVAQVLSSQTQNIFIIILGVYFDKTR